MRHTSLVSGKTMRARETVKGRKSEQVLLEVIRSYPGLSLYEIAKKVGWNTGRVDGAVRRLLSSREVFVAVVDRNGRKVNLVYPIDQKPSNVIEIPSSFLETENPSWHENACVHSLDSSTIGVSGGELPEWKEISCFSSEVPIERVDGKISIRIPDDFARFYDLEKKHRVVSINGNNILVTISGDILEIKRYPS